MDLSNNQITEISHYAFQNTKLISLTLRYNFLTVIPSLDVVAPTLRSLSMTKNLVTSIGDELARMEVLQSFGIRDNKVAKVDPQALRSSASTITDIDLGHNQIKELDAAFFEGMHSLSSLVLQINSLARFPDFSRIRSANALSRLYLNHNDIEDLHETALENMTYLQTLALSNNELTRVPNLKDQRDSLRNLYLSYNQITTISDDTFTGMRISFLNLGNNGLSDLASLAPLNDYLEHLHLTGNDLGHMTSDDLLRFLIENKKVTTL
uniref:Uncharacterized protein n=1 Tax=Capitella teleta TaxID=283909 RepID=X2B5W2_CAPTE